jgi:DNA-binding transcriptional MerR regulator
VVERAHLSIGEVLSLLREEFSDVTISKIRFLESQGLLDPERTPSGYRKFYDEDVERLRWILRQQREHYLPLKVIKGRLTDQSDNQSDHGNSLEDELVPAPPEPAFAGAGAGPVPNVASPPDMGGPDLLARPHPPLAPAPSGGNYTLDELAIATGLSEQAIVELAGYGLIGSRDVGGTEYYDEDAATIAALAAGFARHGVEARHLRMYKNAAERESALFEQIVMPLVKQRNPQARQQAATALEDLGRMSAELRRALLRQALGKAF